MLRTEEPDYEQQWWRQASKKQIRELFWHTARGLQCSDYPIIDYLWSLRDSRQKNFLIECLREEIDMDKSGILSGTMSPLLQKENNCSREARLIECRILTLLVLSASLENLEEETETLALHYSVDVQMSEKFIDWLKKIGQSAKPVLEILGFDGEPSDNGDTQWLLVENFISPSLQFNSQDETPESKKRRLSLKSRREGTPLTDERFHVELKFESPKTPLQNHKPKTSPHYKRKNKLDATIILESPPRLPICSSRSSTPGCSQQIRKLSLEE